MGIFFEGGIEAILLTFGNDFLCFLSNGKFQKNEELEEKLSKIVSN